VFCLMNRVKLLQNFQAVAEHLTDKPLVVRMRQPVFSDARGCAYKTKSGYMVIDLSPEMPVMMMYHTFLHEVAHVGRQFDRFKKTDLPELEPDSITPDHPRNGKPSVSLENEADNQAELWNEWAIKSCTKVLSPNDPSGLKVSCYLAALKFYKDEKK